MPDELETISTEAVLMDADEFEINIRTKDETINVARFLFIRVEQPGTYIVAQRPGDDDDAA